MESDSQHRQPSTHSQDGGARWAAVIHGTSFWIMARVLQVAQTAGTCEVHLWNQKNSTNNRNSFPVWFEYYFYKRGSTYNSKGLYKISINFTPTKVDFPQKIQSGIFISTLSEKAACVFDLCVQSHFASCLHCTVCLGYIQILVSITNFCFTYNLNNFKPRNQIKSTGIFNFFIFSHM